MFIQILKSKLHNLKVTSTNLNYEGSITLDEELIKISGLYEYEKVHVLNLNNGQRIETYIIKNTKNTGEVCLNGPAARIAVPGDLIIVLSYCFIPISEINKHKPTIIIIDPSNNKPLKTV